jgi:hypothetical protein
VGHAVEKFGSAAVLVASYSKAAAVEIAAKCPTIEPSHVGTLHAMGYRAIGKPKLVDDKGREFAHIGYSSDYVTPGGADHVAKAPAAIMRPMARTSSRVNPFASKAQMAFARAGATSCGNLGLTKTPADSSVSTAMRAPMEKSSGGRAGAPFGFFGAAFFAGNKRLFFRADALDEIGEFFLKRVFFLDVDFLDAVFRVFHGLFRHVVERDVGIVLKDADFAGDFVVHAAGREAGDCAVLEKDARVCDVLCAREQETTRRIDSLYFGPYEVRDDIDIVDHEVERDAGLDHPRIVGPQPAAFDEMGVFHELFQALYARIEALDMTDLEEEFFALCVGDQFIGIGQLRGQGFFDQKMHAVIEEVFGDAVMGFGRDDNAHRIDEAQQFFMVRVSACFAALGYFARFIFVDVADADELNTRKARIYVGMPRAQFAQTDDCHPRRSIDHARYFIITHVLIRGSRAINLQLISINKA